MNKVLLIGNLTRDPELLSTNTGVSYCRFSVAVNRAYSNSEGQREVDFFNIIVWRTLAESCGKYLKKGSKVAISGSLQNRTYDDKDNIRRTVTEVVATDVEFLPSASTHKDEGSFSTQEESKPTLKEQDSDDIPF